MQETKRLAVLRSREESCKAILSFPLCLHFDPLIKAFKKMENGMEIGAERKVDIMHFIDDLRIMTDAAWKMERAHGMLCRF